MNPSRNVAPGSLDGIKRDLSTIFSNKSNAVFSPQYDKIRVEIDDCVQKKCNVAGIVKLENAKYKQVQFAGGGFMTCGYIGRVLAMYDCGYIDGTTQFRGASFGCMWAICAAILTGDPTIMSAKDRRVIFYKIVFAIMNYGEHVHCEWFKTLGECATYSEMAIRYIPESLLPDIGNRVEMSVSRIRTSPFFPFIYLENEMVTDFTTVDELIDGFVTTQYIPFWTEMMGTVRTMKNGGKYLDGGLTDNCNGKIAAVGKMSERNNEQLTVKPRSMLSVSLFYPHMEYMEAGSQCTPETCRISSFNDICRGIDDFTRAALNPVN